jgi:hypothetical protein
MFMRRKLKTMNTSFEEDDRRDYHFGIYSELTGRCQMCYQRRTFLTNILLPSRHEGYVCHPCIINLRDGIRKEGV